MEFQPIEYMEWAKLKSFGAVNLSRSGMPGLSLRDLPLSLEGLDINGEQPYGLPPLLEAIASRYGARPENVVPTVGTSQAIFFACAALLERGDAVLVERPAYEPLLSCARVLGAEIRRFERRFEDGYQIDPDHFRAALSDKTKLVVLTNLHNPSGAFLSGDRIRTLAHEAHLRGAWLFIDEIYLEYMGGNEARSSFGLAENLFTASSLTKVYGLAGLRCGWILAPAPLAGKMRRLMDYLFVEHVYIGEMLAVRVFPHLDAIREKNRPLIERNRETVRRLMAEEPALAWVEPPAGIVGFPRVSGPLDGDALAGILSQRFDTTVVPGRFFEDPRHFRLGFGVPTEILARGVANIKKALAE
ncbi:MAG: pyridoxal phosphate-dependent aminotransferase [Candidatus Aminicenantales bacterium]